MIRAAACAAALIALVACQRVTPPSTAPAPAAARLEATIALPHGASAHVIELAQPPIDTTRCVVVVSATGAVAAACPSSTIAPVLD